MDPMADLLEGLVQADFSQCLTAVEGRVDLIVTSPPYEDARSYGGDLLARQSDGCPWIDVAREIARDRYSQRTIFDVAGVGKVTAKQLSFDGS